MKYQLISAAYLFAMAVVITAMFVFNMWMFGALK